MKRLNTYTMKTEIFKYLDELRDSGVTNMFGAVPYILEEFDVTRKEAKEYLINWMKQ